MNTAIVETSGNDSDMDSQWQSPPDEIRDVLHAQQFPLAWTSPTGEYMILGDRILELEGRVFELRDTICLWFVGGDSLNQLFKLLLVDWLCERRPAPASPEPSLGQEYRRDGRLLGRVYELCTGRPARQPE